jgi:hypothetical protein
MVVPTTNARAAVRMLHTATPAAARLYLARSTVGSWTSHDNPSMASGAQAVVDGFDWYAQSHAADGRAFKALDEQAVVALPSGSLSVRLDVVLDDGDDLAGRVVLWDGPDFAPGSAPVMACAFAYGMQTLYPGRSFTTIGVWQARRQRLVEVPFAQALAQTTSADSILASL